MTLSRSDLYCGARVEFDHTDKFGDTRRYVVRVEYDDDADAPWDREDGHGPVSDWTTRAKRPGEWVLNSNRSCKRFYDAQAAQALARRDGWGADGATQGERAANAVRADFDLLRAWCNNDWCYVGVCVTLMVPDGFGALVESTCGHSVWGIESTSDDYLLETAHDLAEECAYDANEVQK